MGSKLLKVTGILCIIGGGLGIIMSFVALAGVGVLSALGASAGVLMASVILALLGSGVELAAGILGVRLWNKPSKAMTCIVIGGIVLLLCLVSDILMLVGYPQNFSFLSVVTGLVIPVLYLVGAFQNRSQC